MSLASQLAGELTKHPINPFGASHLAIRQDRAIKQHRILAMSFR